jgi:hypothetical protein
VNLIIQRVFKENNQGRFMKNAFLRRDGGQMRSSSRWLGASVIAGLLLAAVNLFATGATVNWVSGGPNYGYPTGAGYADGDITLDAEYHTPCGIAVDLTGNYVFVADRNNNAVRILEFDNNQASHLIAIDGNGNAVTNMFHSPVGVAIDSSDNIFVLNYGNGINGNVLEFPSYSDGFITNITSLTNAGGIALDTSDNIYVTASNTVFKISPLGVSNIVTTITTPRASLQGIVVKRSGPTAGLLAVCDSGRNGIYLINPTSGVVMTNAGFHGAGDFVSSGNNALSNSAKFFQPTGVAEAGDGSLVVTDFGNHRVKVVQVSGVVTNLYGVSSNDWVYFNTPPYQFPGFLDGTVVVPDQPTGVAARQPFGVAFAPDGSIYVTEDYYHIIRHVTGAGFLPPPPPAPAAPTIVSVATNFGQVTLTWSPVATATNYNIKRSPSPGGPYTTIASTTATSYTDTTVVNGTTYYYVVTAVNAGGESLPSNEVNATPPLPPVPNPQIGWVTFPPTAFTSVFNVGSPSGVTFNNDVPIVIIGAAGSQTYYTYTNTMTVTNVPDPTSGSASAPVGYVDGLSSVAGLTVAQILPNLAIKAIGEQSGHPNSAIVSALFQFVVGNPIIFGNNAAQFTVTNITVGAQMWYTLDGTDPTNAAPSLGPITTGQTLSLSFGSSTNLLFKIRGFKVNYQPSGVVSNVFSIANFLPNAISFGFASGEASSDFVASPGQTFYAPVTLTTLPAAVMYSLQFNVTVNTGPTNPGPALGGPPAPFNFQSMLMKPVPGVTPVVYTPILPEMFVNGGFTNLVFTNLSENLLGVGWVERAGATNLYDTTKQTLITYSLAHDDLFPNPAQPNEVIVGGYSFQVPASATPGQTYQIQIARPTATSDGIGAPGSSVSILAPTNGSLAGGAINSIKNVTLGNRKYIAGNSYPFRWFNAGDFGNTNLQNADVEQVFQSAIYQLNYPPANSDFFDAMDSCGVTYIDNGFGYLQPNAPVANTSVLFDGNDTTINQIAFGDGVLDVCDVYVTYRRSLDTNLVWFARFWTNDVAHGVSGRVAQITPNVFNPSLLTQPIGKLSPALILNPGPVSITNTPTVNFVAGNFQATAGQTIQIPITATVFGNYPLRVAMLNITVVPLDGSPPLTTPVTFSPGTALGTPYTTDSIDYNNYAAAWLDSTIAGISNSATIGTLTVTIPANATSLSAYAIHFDHASGSPNGLASFPKHTLTGLITLSSRNTSTYNDGIPDSWRLRYFGTVYNLLSVSNADADGTGVNNWQKYIAGLDPTDATSKLTAGLDQPMAQSQQDSVIDWPSMSGKQYVIQRSPALFPAVWTPIYTNNGTGGYMEIHDSPTNKFRYYRVSVQ